MILVEGYTDVLALHQAGLRNAVGIMGTSLTEEQVAELERVVRVLELCLDADRAGQEAMLRAAARWPRGASSSCASWRCPRAPIPPSSSSARAPTRSAPGWRRRCRSSSSTSSGSSAAADTRSAEGRDRALQELAPVLAELPASVLRDELVRRVAGPARADRGEADHAAVLRRGAGAADGGSRGSAGPGGAPGNGHGAPERVGAGPSSAAAGHAMRSERIFLALCIALPDLGADALARIDIDQLLTTEAMRRAARHLAQRTRTPLADLPADDEEFARTLAGLVELAGRVPDPSAERLEHARLVLERDRLDRAIIRARGEGAGTGELAREREAVRDAIRAVVARLEKAL